MARRWTFPTDVKAEHRLTVALSDDQAVVEEVVIEVSLRIPAGAVRLFAKELADLLQNPIVREVAEETG